MLAQEGGKDGRHGGALLKAQELVLINCFGEVPSHGRGQGVWYPNPLVSVGEEHHVQRVVPSGGGPEQGLDLYWDLHFYCPNYLSL